MSWNAPWIATFTGKAFCYTQCHPETICVADIVTALSRLPRFLGHTPLFYSVAEHSYWVAQHVPAECKLEALLHDASEAYLGDMPKPLKAMMPEYSALEDEVSQAIADRFGAVYPWPAAVKEADLRMLETEHRDLMFNSPPWNLNFGEPYPEQVKCWSTKRAAFYFLRELELELRKRADR